MINLCEKRDAHLTRLIDKEIQSARAHQANNNKRLALECMKRKRLHESERDQLAVKKLNLMKSEATLNALRFNTLVVTAAERGAADIEREIKKAGGIDEVERTVDRMDDALADAGDVLGAAARSIGVDDDDDELLGELDQLELDAMSNELCKVNIGTNASTSKHAPESIEGLFAQVPQTVPAAGPSREELEAERELSRLRSSMAVEQPMPMPMAAMCH